MKKRVLVTGVLLAGAFSAVIYAGAAAAIRRSGAVVSLFYKNETILAALDRLSAAEITPPLWLPLTAGIAAALICCFAFAENRRGAPAVFFKSAAVLVSVLITTAAFAGTLYFTGVNGIPVHTAAEIIAGIIESGILG